MNQSIIARRSGALRIGSFSFEFCVVKLERHQFDRQVPSKRPPSVALCLMISLGGETKCGVALTDNRSIGDQ